MALKEYQKKRRFSATPEPKGKVAKGKGSLVFCVQKHAASRLHYDFRLELDGVLKSWAVPKGPSLDPTVRRLAMQVEDHPFDYRTFEGIIPPGNYGAGTVMLWDEGTYEAIDSSGRQESESAMRAGLHKGHIKFILHGTKLNGEWSMLRMPPERGKASWLLVKKQDGHALKDDILRKDRSVASKRSMEEIAGAKKPKVWQSSKKKPPSSGRSRAA